MLVKARSFLFSIVIIVGALSFLKLSTDSIRLTDPEKTYWPNWTLQSFECLDELVNQFETDKEITLDIQDPLLFQRLVEIGFPSHKLTTRPTSITISDRDLVGSKEGKYHQCGNWKIFVDK
jgi:hypothetical protein